MNRVPPRDGVRWGTGDRLLSPKSRNSASAASAIFQPLDAESLAHSCRIGPMLLRSGAAARAGTRTGQRTVALYTKNANSRPNKTTTADLGEHWKTKTRLPFVQG
jgi:hypothetical protein